MMNLKFRSLLIFLSILSAACTKELKYSKEELLAKAVAADPTATVILPRSMEEGVSCDAYTAGCLSAHTVKVKELDLIAVEYATQDQAIAGAKKFRGYYTRNWLLDDVAGEPILERFATEILKAEKP